MRSSLVVKKRKSRRVPRDYIIGEERQLDSNWSRQLKWCFQCNEILSRKSFKRGQRICRKCLRSPFPLPAKGSHSEIERRGIYFILRFVLPTARLNPSSKHLAPTILTGDLKRKINIHSSSQEPKWDFKLNKSKICDYFFLLLLSKEKLLPKRILLLPGYLLDFDLLPHRLELDKRRNLEKFNCWDIRFQQSRLLELNQFQPIPLLNRLNLEEKPIYF